MRNRGIIIFAVFLIFMALIGGALYFLLPTLLGGGNSGDVTPEGTPTPMLDTTEIVVAAQDIPRGMRISTADNAVMKVSWPIAYLPEGYLVSTEELDGKFARTDIPRGTPMLLNMVTASGPTLFPQGLVAYAIPMDPQGAVAWALKEGDHVDVLAALKLVAVDPEFQTKLPNSFMVLVTGEETDNSVDGTFGRFEILPSGNPAVITPNGDPFPTLVVQLTVQDAIVWHVGIWKDLTETEVEPGQAPAPDTSGGTPDTGGVGLAGGGLAQEETPVPTETRGDVEPVTLLVNRQDALVLKYLTEMGADLDLVLRPAGDTEQVLTDPVWLRYVLDRYQIPDTQSDLPVAPTPIRSAPLEVTVAPPPTPEE